MWPFTKETRSLENPAVAISQDAIANFFVGSGLAESGVNVTVETALGIPAVWSAINFLSGEIAGLPLNVYEKTDDSREKTAKPIQAILHDAVNDEQSSFEWRKCVFEQVLSTGRSVSFIERNATGQVINIWPLDTSKVTIKRIGGRKQYTYRDGNRVFTYQASEVIDVPFMLASDMLSHRSPILTNKDAIGQIIAATNYGARFFANGGVPPFMITGPFSTGDAMARASRELEDAIKRAAKEKRHALALPAGHDVKTIGADPDKSQLLELQRFGIEQIARIYSLPPTFLQDLTHGTFSNTEQQDLHFVKHTLKRWIEQFEQELNLKLFGRGQNSIYAEFNIDGLLRGDFKSRMEGYATAIQNAISTPNEVRVKENKTKLPGGDNLMIQSATVPINGGSNDE